jgi:plasmid stabilization system protein ParE
LRRVIIQAAARQELREITAWYRESNQSVADRFVTEVFKTLENIEQSRRRQRDSVRSAQRATIARCWIPVLRHIRGTNRSR